ncbi:hypothetical protein M406DRAFT_102582, partial [Cryphonectria parasitica EP155]
MDNNSRRFWAGPPHLMSLALGRPAVVTTPGITTIVCVHTERTHSFSLSLSPPLALLRYIVFLNHSTTGVVQLIAGTCSMHPWR